MLLKTILNRLYGFKSFVYTKGRFIDGDDGLRIEVKIESRKNGRAVCSSCETEGVSCYDRRSERQYQFMPLWGIPVFLLYAPRRVS